MTRLPGRVVVLGVTGAGKSTAARRIARIIQAKYIELDSLFHGPNWTPVEPEEFRSRIRLATGDTERWVTDGNYTTQTADILWTQADSIIWLDYPLRITLARLFRRTLSRIIGRKELWSGNRETMRSQFASKDSLFLWALKSHPKQRRTYPARFARPEMANIDILRFRRPAELNSWMRRLMVLANSSVVRRDFE